MKSEILDFNQPFDLIEKIKTMFREHFFIRHAYSDVAYIAAFAIIVVDSITTFHKKVKHLDPKPLTDVDRCVRVYQFPDIVDNFIPYLAAASAFPLQVLVIENKESIDWLTTAIVPKKKNDAYSKAVKVRDYLFHVYRLELIDAQVRWINSRCKNLLETIPREKPQITAAREERYHKLIDASMNLEFYYTSYVIAKDFVIREREQEEIIASNYNEFTSKSTIQESLNVLEETLNHLKNSLQSRITLEGILVEKHKDARQAGTERRLGILQLYFAMFVLLEITAAYMAWWLDPNIFENHITWWVILGGAVLAMIYGVWSISSEDKEE